LTVWAEIEEVAVGEISLRSPLLVELVVPGLTMVATGVRLLPAVIRSWSRLTVGLAQAKYDRAALRLDKDRSELKRQVFSTVSANPLIADGLSVQLLDRILNAAGDAAPERRPCADRLVERQFRRESGAGDITCR
jgi:hypothetical protein